MTQGLEMAECPFSGHGEELVNVKFFRGFRDDVITAGEIREQAHRAVMQHRLGAADVSGFAPTSGRNVIDVVEFVATL